MGSIKYINVHIIVISEGEERKRLRDNLKKNNGPKLTKFAGLLTELNPVVND